MRGMNRKFWNHLVYHCGKWKAKDWSRGSSEGGHTVSPNSTPGHDAADCDLAALRATPEQHVVARRVGYVEQLTFGGNLSTSRPRTEKSYKQGREEGFALPHHHFPGCVLSSMPGTRMCLVRTAYSGKSLSILSISASLWCPFHSQSLSFAVCNVGQDDHHTM